MPCPGASRPLGVTKWLPASPMLFAFWFIWRMKRPRGTMPEARASAASLPESRNRPKRRSRTVTLSPGVNPMTLGTTLVIGLLMSTTLVSDPASSTATIAVIILVKLGGARRLGVALPQDLSRVEVDEKRRLAMDRQSRLAAGRQPVVREVEVVESPGWGGRCALQAELERDRPGPGHVDGRRDRGDDHDKRDEERESLATLPAPRPRAGHSKF